jgi:hypothetical protein
LTMSPNASAVSTQRPWVRRAKNLDLPREGIVLNIDTEDPADEPILEYRDFRVTQAEVSELVTQLNRVERGLGPWSDDDDYEAGEAALKIKLKAARLRADEASARYQAYIHGTSHGEKSVSLQMRQRR